MLCRFYFINVFILYLINYFQLKIQPTFMLYTLGQCFSTFYVELAALSRTEKIRRYLNTSKMTNPSNNTNKKTLVK